MKYKIKNEISKRELRKQRKNIIPIKLMMPLTGVEMQNVTFNDLNNRKPPICNMCKEDAYFHFYKKGIYQYSLCPNHEPKRP